MSLSVSYSSLSEYRLLLLLPGNQKHVSKSGVILVSYLRSANIFVPFSICSQCPLQKGPLFEMFLPFLLLSVSYLFILLSPLANRKPPPYINQISVSCSDFPQTGFYFLDSQIFKSKRTSAATATAPDPKKRRSIKVLKKQISNLNIESTSLKKKTPTCPRCRLPLPSNRTQAPATHLVKLFETSLNYG